MGVHKGVYDLRSQSNFAGLAKHKCAFPFCLDKDVISQAGSRTGFVV